MRRSAFIVLLCATATLPLCSQTSAAKPTPPAPKPLAGAIVTHPGWPVAKPADVVSIDALTLALYDVISGPAGKPRDWDRFRSLFLPEGRLGIVRPARAAGTDAKGQPLPARAGDVFFLTPDMYIERDAPFFATEGFFERGIANRVEEFGNLISVWSTYESRHAAADATPFARGINSIQIVHAQDRYWIASILWDDERPGLTLPPKYLKP